MAVFFFFFYILFLCFLREREEVMGELTGSRCELMDRVASVTRRVRITQWLKLERSCHVARDLKYE